MLRIAVCFSIVAAGVGAQAQPVSAPDAVVTKYCLGCHNDKLTTGGVSLSGMHAADVTPHARTWEKVLRKMRTGEMPPVGLPGPEAATRASLVSLLEKELDRASLAKPNPGAPSIHRLNRAEYSNAVRDLLALDFDHTAGLPPDDSGYGFDNIGDVLSVSPLHLEKYMSTARRVTRLALGTGKSGAAIERFPTQRGSANDTIDELPPAERGGILIRRYFPLDAEYTFLVRVRQIPAVNAPGPKLDLRLDGKRVKLFDVNVNPAEEAQDTRNYEIRIPVQAGMRVVGAAFLSEFAKPEGLPPARRGNFTQPSPTPASVEYVQVAGPLSPIGPGNTESRRRIFVCRPVEGKSEEPCARQILGTLARRAYRRTVTPADLAPLMKLFAVGRADGGSFEAGIETALRAVLVSPAFLFRIERDPAGKTPGAHRVSDIELASRLSFFLWSSIPDDELLKLAEHGKLRQPATLEQQVRRMLADAKSKSLVENFAGQWLHLRNVASWRPDPEKYAGFDESLRNAMRGETEAFFQHIVREDRPVLDFLDADYTYVNERLARHYGIAGVRGSYFRRVSVTGPERGGIMTQASVLTVSSYPTRTSPVLRGKWILENVLGAPPPPPPPDVPTLADSADTSPKNLRQQLEKHRASAACAACHSRLDPLGFTLENFDAIGKFRTSEGGAEIDASGSMPNGTTVRGPADLKKVMLERRDQFVECLADKLLTYALGRGVEYYDLPAVRQVRREAAARDYKFSALILSIVNSVPFQMRRSPDL
jgi:hypothetical protein